MALFLRIILFLFIMACSFTAQIFTRWSPWINLGVSFLIVLVLPPFWSAPLIGGIWVACAFFTFHPENEKKIDVASTLNWQRLLLSSLWTFSGFLLTLLFLWKMKVYSNLSLFQREIAAWFFLVGVEICLYKVIARLSLRLQKIPLGYGIAILNFIMILYWLIPLGLFILLLTFVSLLIVSPLLLIWLDPSSIRRDSFLGGNK